MNTRKAKKTQLFRQIDEMIYREEERKKDSLTLDYVEVDVIKRKNDECVII